jgi:hypothetical protein
MIRASTPSLTKQLVGPLMATAVAATNCTTFVEPTTCERGSTACGGIHDARFCDYVADAIEGTDCAALNIAPSKHFCVVTTRACIDTNYEVKSRDCKVLRYSLLSDNFRDECSPDTPMFVNR